MPSSQRDAKVIVVLGATGNQGGGVIRALLQKTSPSFHVRALTRDITSTGAVQLQARFQNDPRLDLVAADLYDSGSLVKAFTQAYGVFAVTNNRLQGRKIETEKDMDHELEAGRNIIDAAKSCNVRHLVMSSLPNLTEASKGQFTKVFHFDNKSKIEQWAKEELPCVTALHPGLFYTNMQWSQYCCEDDGIVRFCAPIDGDVRSDWTDPTYDIGVYAAEVFCLGPEKTASKVYPVVSQKVSSTELVRMFTKATSRKAIFSPSTLDQWGTTVAATVGKGYEEDIKQMMEWISVAPDDRVCYGTMKPEDDKSWEDLGVKASTFTEWMNRVSWRGP